jgi:hypothetical protein
VEEPAGVWHRLRRMQTTIARSILPVAALVLATVAACGGTGGPPSAAPTPSARPPPTPVTAEVAAPGDAAALVIAANPIFAGAMPENPDTIGASKWWVATPLAEGGYEIVITVGWGDCMAGCIERHTWTYEVSPDGAVELISDEGDPVPSDLPA